MDGYFQTNPNWNWFYPEHWLSGFFLVCIGLETFFFPLFSLASSESNQETT